jgi:hypothetical protein
MTSWTKAKNSFDAFLLAVQEHGWKVLKSTKNEDIVRHIDGYMVKGRKKMSFDFKSRKRVSRGDNGRQDEFVWIEFINVRGNKGWVFGEADWIVFERELDYLFVERRKLANLASLLVDFSKTVDEARHALYGVYTRKGRFDQISMLKMRDVVEISSFTLNKNHELS